MPRIRFFLLLLLLTTALAQAQPEVESRVEALLGKMTTEEKLGQLQMFGGVGQGDLPPEHIALLKQGRLGTTLNIRGAARVNRLQKIAVEETRLGIPLIFAFDVIHGYRTVFPI
ncbi:MAG: glycosyl hydrolase, partial [Candidatus Eremiobacteraeota bacterium]|nr:glycosyl hydrolase [Candidatus Eremiobacteraeota bacterium]